MKRFLTLFAIGLGILTAMAAELKTSSPGFAEFTELYRQWDVALVKGDVAALDKIYAEDASLVDGDGVVTSKKEFMRMVKAGEYKVSDPVTSELVVRIYGNSAVALSTWKAVETDKSGTHSSVYRFTDTWVKSSGRWEIVASQGTAIKPQK